MLLSYVCFKKHDIMISNSNVLSFFSGYQGSKQKGLKLLSLFAMMGNLEDREEISVASVHLTGP